MASCRRRLDTLAHVTDRARLAWWCVATFLVGGIVGVLSTLMNQGIWYIGSVGLPWGLVVGSALAVCFLIGVRLYFESRWPVIAAAVGFVSVCAIALTETPGGSVLVQGNIYGTAWALIPGLLGVIVAGWPRLRRNREMPTN